MTPVDQTKTLENSERGNCLAACVASIFDLEIDDVPQFEEMTTKTWRKALEDFAAELGYGVAQEVAQYQPQGHYLIIGRNAAGVRHACVGCDGAVVHDPHKERPGLASIEFVIYFPEK
jgi:hypothetical protein